MRFIKGNNLKEAIRRFHEADKPGRDPSDGYCVRGKHSSGCSLRQTKSNS
jgi:hypothetical protein